MTWTWLFVWNVFWLLFALLYVYSESFLAQPPDSEAMKLRKASTEIKSAYGALGRDEIDHPCRRRLRHLQRLEPREHQRPRRPPGRGSQRF
jgi:hypothetical protein